MYYKNMQVTEIEAASILTPQKVGSLAGMYDYSLNPYAGCAFRCSYCYVPKFPSARHDDFTQWGKWVEVKINAPELIRKERNKVFSSSIFFSSATDPYQYLELKYRLTRRCLGELLRYRPARITMHTRSHLMLQDIDLLKAFGDVLRVGVSITTDDESVRKEFEPGAPSFARRLSLLEGLQRAGIAAYASLSPLLPCNPERLVRLLKPYVNTCWVDSMRSLEVNNRPDLLVKYADFFEPRSYSQTQEWIYNQLTGKHKASRSSKTYAAKRSDSNNRANGVTLVHPKVNALNESAIAMSVSPARGIAVNRNADHVSGIVMNGSSANSNAMMNQTATLANVVQLMNGTFVEENGLELLRGDVLHEVVMNGTAMNTDGTKILSEMNSIRKAQKSDSEKWDYSGDSPKEGQVTQLRLLLTNI